MLMVQNLMFRMKGWAHDFFTDENGDTNFISILIVLGIVVVLYVFFKGQIDSILSTVKGQVSQFTGFSAD